MQNTPIVPDPGNPTSPKPQAQEAEVSVRDFSSATETANQNGEGAKAIPRQLGGPLDSLGYDNLHHATTHHRARCQK